MRKMPTLFVRDWDGDTRYVTSTPNPECDWVFAGVGTPTVKWDGTCCMVDGNGDWWARREVKPGKTTPPDFRPIATDDETGKVMGWEPVAQSSHARWHAEALDTAGHYKPGTYELVGPKVNGNPDGFGAHILIEHGWAHAPIREDLKTAPRDYDGLAEWLRSRPYEGIVWHHPDGERFAKIKKKDFPMSEGSR